MTRPPLLVLTTTFPRWENDVEPPFVFELCRRLRDFEVHVVAPHAPGALTEEIMDGVHVHRFRYAPEKLETLAFNGGISANLKRSPWKYLLLQGFLLGMFFRALQVARKYDIHLIHAHWMVPTGLIGAALKELLPGNNKLMVTAHGGDVHSLRGNLFSRLRRWVSEESDTLCVVGNHLKATAKAEQWQANKIYVAPMGVDMQEQFTPGLEKPTGKTLVFAGRLVQKKGVLHLLEAMKMLLVRISDIHLVIAGHGPLDKTLKARCKSLGLDSHVQFLGRYSTSQLPDILRSGNVAVLPFDTAQDGDQEGLGLTIIEAMGCGIPVVAGDVPAVHDVIEHGHTGLLVDSRNHQALSDAIAMLLENPESAEKLATAARELVLQRFDWEATAATYRNLLNDL